MTIAMARTTASARIAVPFPMGVASMAAFLAAATGIHAAISAAREYPSYLGTQLFCAFRPPRAPCNGRYGRGWASAALPEEVVDLEAPDPPSVGSGDLLQDAI